jgi:hypothetical protein
MSDQKFYQGQYVAVDSELSNPYYVVSQDDDGKYTLCNFGSTVESGFSGDRLTKVVIYPDGVVARAREKGDYPEMPDPESLTLAECADWVSEFMVVFPQDDPRFEFARKLGLRIREFAEVEKPEVDYC